MAKVYGPLFSLDARGQLGRAIVYTVWKGINAVRRYIIPQNPNTEDQVTQRGYFTAAVENWQGLDAAGKTLWDEDVITKGKVMSGFNWHNSRYIDYMVLYDGAEDPPDAPADY